MLFHKLSHILLAFLIMFVSCEPGKRAEAINKWKSSKNQLKILCTTGMIESLVRDIGGEGVVTLPLIIGELDPHSYEPVKGDLELFKRADIVFYTGLGMEHGPSLNQVLKEHPCSISLGDNILKRYKEDILYTEEGVIDPHIWMDMSLWAKSISFICEMLCEKMPENKAVFVENSRVLESKILAQHQSYQKMMQKISEEKRFLVTSHDAFHYFTRAYLAEPKELGDNSWRERCQAPEGLAPESQIGIVDIERIVNHLLKHSIRVIFSESNLNPQALKKIIDACSQKGLNVRLSEYSLFGDAMGDTDSQEGSYCGMIDHNVTTIYHELVRD